MKKRFGKIKIVWSPQFAYAIGLLATDGNLSNDRRHINFTSKDRELVILFMRCLEFTNKVGRKSRAKNAAKKYFQVQFGDVRFYNFLLGLGLTPNKSKTLAEVYVPRRYFFDFLRGCFDGDGTFYSYWDPRWKSSFMFYAALASASKEFVAWVRGELFKKLRIKGHLSRDARRGIYQLRYGKKESMKMLRKMYYHDKIVCLPRKRLKIKKALGIIGVSL
ncbi:hypothetical protein KGQ34_00930 [Patescibacteria group bacterium]|nr:hypothetical protein [Patescibacteria group bacterium]